MSSSKPRSKHMSKLRTVAFLMPMDKEAERIRQMNERRASALEEAKAASRDRDMRSAHVRAQREIIENAKALVDTHSEMDERPRTAHNPSMPNVPWSIAQPRPHTTAAGRLPPMERMMERGDGGANVINKD